MNTLAILWGTFGNFRPLSLTTSGLRQSLYKLIPLPTSNARYREHLIKAFTTWVLSVTFDHYL